jgi:hypothetical protein
MSAMRTRRVVLPTLSFDDLAEMERQTRIDRKLNHLHEDPVKPSKRRVRPGEEPNAYQAEALLLYHRTHGH